MQKKLVVLYIIVLLAFVGLGVRIIYINKDNGDSYKRQVYSQQKYESSALPYKRGDIVDRKGSKLAYSEKVYNLIVDTVAMHENEGKYVEPTLAAIGKFFPEVDVAAIRAYMEEVPTSRYKKFAKYLTYDQIQAYKDYEKEAKSDNTEAGGDVIKDVAGVWFEEDYKRRYPYGSLACDVIGFTQGNNLGYFGLEDYYNDVLNGTNGRRYGYLTEDDIVEQSIKPAVDGNTIVTTIDTNIQSIVEKHLVAFNEEHRNEAREGNGAKNIGCIIMDPNNGEVLAMASYPFFDLNDPGNLEAFYSPEEIAQMDDGEVSQARNQIWKNFCISDTYEPGSTAKPFTVAAAIEDGDITGNESYNCTGAIDVGEHTIHCHNRLGDGYLSVTQGIQKSCNVVLMNVAFAMGREKWLKYNRLFNFGLKTNIDLAGETNAASLVFNESMGQTDLAVGSFGQGFNVTMIQIAAGYCSLINGGYYYQPHLVSKILNSEGATVEEIEPRLVKQTIANSTSDKIKDMLRSVVMEGSEGTGYTARPAGYTMGGKTGTAEKLPRDKQNYLVSFCGYVPADDPQVLIYVVIDQPNTIAQDNARFATVLTRDIMTEVLPYMNIFMTEELTDEEKEELARKQQTFSIASGSVSVNEIGEMISTDQNAEESDENPDGQGPSADNEYNVPGTEEDGVVTGDGEAEGEESEENTIKYDPETGYPIDPNTGEVLNPDTLLPVSGSTSFMD